MFKKLIHLILKSLQHGVLYLMNNNDYLREISKSTNTNSVLIIDGKYKLKRIFCPFWVKCIKAIDEFKEEDILKVTAVKISRSLRMVYIIGGKGYFHSSFVIL